jgi:hypothetical protein
MNDSLSGLNLSANPSLFGAPLPGPNQEGPAGLLTENTVPLASQGLLGAPLYGPNEEGPNGYLQSVDTVVPGSVFQVPLASAGKNGTADISGSSGLVNPFAALDGVFTVGAGGLLSIDVLADNGDYQSQVGVFRLTGMENLKIGSADFMQEAARRATVGNGQGYLMFDDATQGARFDGELGEANCNRNQYSGAKTVGFAAGEKVALILVPNGRLQDVAAGNMGGAMRPLFSIAAANTDQVSQLAKVSTNTFGWEDIGGKSFSDKDYNDLIIKVTGASGQVADLSKVINGDRDWQQNQFAQQIINFAGKSDAVLGWNKAALEAIKTEKTNPPIATRNLAILEAAVFDAVNGLAAVYNSYKVNNGTDAGASIEAAASQAAYRVLTELYPNQKATFDGILNGFLQDLPAGEFVDKGLAYGQAVAEATLANRANDGSNKVVPYVASKEIGKWQPTSAVTSPLLPQWGNVTTFALTSGNQFRPDASPALTSAEYAQDFNLTKEVGSINSTTRTADQTEIAKFWADGGGTYTPPGHWNDIANQLLSKNNVSLVESAHTLGLLNIALADAAIACWDAK